MDISTDLREKAVRVMRRAKDELGARTTGPGATDVKHAIAAACTSVGITPQDYATALDAAPELAQLERESLREALVGTTDPGPYGEISRESPSGQPGKLDKNRSHPVLGDGGVEPNVAARGSQRRRS